MQLDRRSNSILQLIVEAYIHDAQPVSSSSVARRHPELRLSSATIRAVMAGLKAAGLLYQPHASSGRVPTERGLRAYVDGLTNPRLRPWDRTRLEAATHQEAKSFPSVLGQTLSHLTGQMVMLSVPRYYGARIREVGLVRCDVGRILAYFVSPNGWVQQKLVKLGFDVSADELQTIQNYLNERVNSRSLPEIRQVIQDELANTHASRDQLQEQALAIAARLFPSDQAGDLADVVDVVVEGTSHLLDQPEFADLAKLRALLRTVEEKATLLALLKRILDNTGVVVMLGSEHRLHNVPDLACLGCVSDAAHGPRTAISLLGPSRMDYGRLVPLVQYAAELSARFWERV